MHGLRHVDFPRRRGDPRPRRGVSSVVLRHLLLFSWSGISTVSRTRWPAHTSSKFLVPARNDVVVDGFRPLRTAEPLPLPQARLEHAARRSSRARRPVHLSRRLVSYHPHRRSRTTARPARPAARSASGRRSDPFVLLITTIPTRQPLEMRPTSSEGATPIDPKNGASGSVTPRADSKRSAPAARNNWRAAYGSSSGERRQSG